MRAFITVRNYLLAQSFVSTEIKELWQHVKALEEQSEENLKALNDMGEENQETLMKFTRHFLNWPASRKTSDNLPIHPGIQ